MEGIKDRLAVLLKELDVKPGALSRNIGHSPSYIASILNGRNKSPGQDFYDYMEVCYNVNPKWLKHGEGEMFREGGKEDNFSAAALIKFLYSLPEEEQKAVKVILRALYRKERGKPHE